MTRPKFINPSSLHLSLLIGLPDFAAGDVKAGQPPFARGPGVNADSMTDVNGFTTFLAGVATNHCFPRAVGSRVIKLLPKTAFSQVVWRLAGLDLQWRGQKSDGPFPTNLHSDC